jgi:pimeloyl-ACP methyl ester carboxylesterase
VNGRTKPYRVSYADYGDPTSKAVVLFFGGLMGGRFCYSPLDKLAKKHGVRIIHPDRPGVGGSNAVAIEDRIPTYIDMIPKLLQHLGIERVSLAAHSFGTIYLINTMLTYPHLLHPERPYVAFFAPWVHPEHTGIKHLQAAEMLPASIIGKFSSLAKFVNGSITPLVGMSMGLSSTVTNSVKTSLPQTVATEVPIPLEPHARGSRTNEGDGENQGLDLDDPAVVKELRDFIPTFLFAEENTGVGQDTQLCLRKPRSIPWSISAVPWEDVDDAVRIFERSESVIAQNDRAVETTRIWSVDTFHAATDSMVGSKGQKWFDSCWANDETAASNNPRPYEYHSQIVEGSDHDFILDPVFGASETWLKRAGEAFGERGVSE